MTKPIRMSNFVVWNGNYPEVFRQQSAHRCRGRRPAWAAPYRGNRKEPLERAVGAGGSLAVPAMRLKYCARKQDRSWWKPFQRRVVRLERKDPLAEQIEHFAAVIRSEAGPLVATREGLKNLRATGAIVEAAKRGRIVETNNE